MTDLHIVYTEAGDEYGWTIESPQIPELIGGRSTIEELILDTPGIVEWAKDQDQTFERTFMHEQHLVADPDGGHYLIRFQVNHDDDDESRYETASRLNFAIVNGLVLRDEYGPHPPLNTGERLYVVAVGTDTLGWIRDQLDGRDQPCVLAEDTGDGAVVHLPFAPTGVLPGGLNTESLGLDRESTFTEMLNAVLAREVLSLTTRLPRGGSQPIPRHRGAYSTPR